MRSSTAPARAKSRPRRPSEIAVTARRDGERVRVEVADHGPGIPAADRERAIDRFVRLEGARSRPGSGLGLSLAAAVMRMHGGESGSKTTRPASRSSSPCRRPPGAFPPARRGAGMSLSLADRLRDAPRLAAPPKRAAASRRCSASPKAAALIAPVARRACAICCSASPIIRPICGG